jgi:CheY-like chemotaxis protein
MKESSWTQRLAATKPVKPRVLVCDDEALVAMGVAQKLRDYGYDAITCQQGYGHAFLDADDLPGLMEQYQPDAIVTDYQMGITSGLDVGEAGKAYRENMPIIMHTGAMGALPPEHALQGKVDVVLHKPVSPGEMQVHAEKLHGLLSSALSNNGYPDIFPGKEPGHDR